MTAAGKSCRFRGCATNITATAAAATTTTACGLFLPPILPPPWMLSFQSCFVYNPTSVNSRDVALNTAGEQSLIVIVILATRHAAGDGRDILFAADGQCCRIC